MVPGHGCVTGRAGRAQGEADGKPCLRLRTLALSDRWHWPRWLGHAGLAAAVAYLMRTGGMFTDHGAWAADGILGFWIPIAALQGWIFAASLALWLAERRA